MARGLTIADFNDDGLPDLAVSVHRGPPLLLRNETHTEHQFLRFPLHGPAAWCLGARVEAQAGPAVQVQWLGADVSAMSQHTPELIFGLAERTQADRVTVLWRDGRSTRLRSVPTGRLEVRYPHTAHALEPSGFGVIAAR